MTDSHDNCGIERRSILKILGTGALGAAGMAVSSGSVTADPSATHYHNPLYGPDFADPTIHRADDGTWWTYASNMSYNNDADEMLVPILSSPDLVNWTYEGEAFDSRPGWLYGSVWAPDIHYHNGQWVLFYSLWPREDDDSLVPGIGLATSDTPDGPFTDHGEILSNPDHPYPGNTIDPYFVSHNGTPYLFWGNFAGVYVVELTADLQDVRSGTFDQIVGSAYEGATIFQRDGYWYFFGSTGDCCAGFDSTYEIEVGRSENFLGPYYDMNGTAMLDRDEWNAGPTHLGDNARFVGPGHGDVTVADDGSWWFVYHAYDTEGPEYAGNNGWPPARQFFLDPIQWENGWPVIGCDGTPSAQMTNPGLGGYCEGGGPVADGTYYITNANSGLHLEVANGSTSAGANVRQYSDTGCTCQQWNVTQNSSGTYDITNVNSGQFLEVANASTEDGANVRQYTDTGHSCQEWDIVDNGDGTYQLVNANSGKAADVASQSTSDAANVQQWTWNAGDHQRWRFIS